MGDRNLDSPDLASLQLQALAMQEIMCCYVLQVMACGGQAHRSCKTKVHQPPGNMPLLNCYPTGGMLKRLQRSLCWEAHLRHRCTSSDSSEASQARAADSQHGGEAMVWTTVTLS